MGYISPEDEEISDYWRLPEALTIQQAALLVVGIDPSSPTGSNCENWKAEERPRGYEAAKQGIAAALKHGHVKGQIEPEFDTDINGEIYPIHESFDRVKSQVERESLVNWLVSRGFRHGFFFPEATDAPDYLDKRDPRYAPKLAAAVYAWQAVTAPSGKTPKQALGKWLREHASEFGLSDDEGKPNETGIEEVAKVANWQPGGGAAKTPNP